MLCTPPQPCVVISALSSAHIAGVKTSDTGTSRSPVRVRVSVRVRVRVVALACEAAGRSGYRCGCGAGAVRVRVRVRVRVGARRVRLARPGRRRGEARLAARLAPTLVLA